MKGDGEIRSGKDIAGVASSSRLHFSRSHLYKGGPRNGFRERERERGLDGVVKTDSAIKYASLLAALLIQLVGYQSHFTNCHLRLLSLPFLFMFKQLSICALSINAF